MKHSGITEQVRRTIDDLPQGTVFTSAQLAPIGPRAAIDQALARMVKTGHITRVARGVFVRPEQNRFVGPVPPRVADVAEAIARTHGAVIEVQGAEAARTFGLTTQMPVKPVFSTTGPTRRIRLGNLELTLQHRRPRKLALAGRPAGKALAALWYLGKENVTPEVIETIRTQLPPGEFEALVGAISVMPAWMARVFHLVQRGSAG